MWCRWNLDDCDFEIADMDTEYMAVGWHDDKYSGLMGQESAKKDKRWPKINLSLQVLAYIDKFSFLFGLIAG